jgi:hypothetical protein
MQVKQNGGTLVAVTNTMLADIAQSLTSVTSVDWITAVSSGGAAATTGSKKSSFATTRYSVNAVFPMLAALLLLAFGMRA